MSREVKRVPLGFDWPQKEIWWGYLLEAMAKCERCPGEDCRVCYGKGEVCFSVEVPEGPGWQMWETTSEGSPISPVFETPEELARWLADTGASALGSQTATYDQWLAMIVGPGWALSGMLTVGDGMRLQSGVEALSDDVGGSDGE